jgi:hypothetical protein
MGSLQASPVNVNAVFVDPGNCAVRTGWLVETPFRSCLGLVNFEAALPEAVNLDTKILRCSNQCEIQFGG